MNYTYSKVMVAFVAIAFHELCSAQRADNASIAAGVFDKYCLQAPSDFARLDGQATEARYEVFLDRTVPLKGMDVMHQKNWLIPSSLGPATMLTSNDVTNGPTHVFGCGVYAPELSGEAMEQALSSLVDLGKPTRRVARPDGSTTVWWTLHLDAPEGSVSDEVMLAREVPGLGGVTVNLISKTQVRR